MILQGRQGPKSAEQQRAKTQSEIKYLACNRIKREFKTIFKEKLKAKFFLLNRDPDRLHRRDEGEGRPHVPLGHHLPHAHDLRAEVAFGHTGVV